MKPSHILLSIFVVTVLVVSQIIPSYGKIVEQRSTSKVWVRTIEGRLVNPGSCICGAGDGGYIVAAQAVYRTENGSPASSILLVKMDEDGKKVWDRIYIRSGDEFPIRIEQMEDGGFLILAITISNETGTDIWLIRTDKEGNEIWNKLIGGNKSDCGCWLHRTGEGGFIIAGSTESYGSGKVNGWIIRIDENGNELWNTTINRTKAEISLCFITETDDGGYISTGSIKKNDDSDVFLVKLDNNGNVLWERVFPSGPYRRYENGYAVYQTNDGGYMVFARTEKSAWIIRTDSSGNKLWDKTIYDEKKEWANVLVAVYPTDDGGYIAAGLKIVKKWIMNVPVINKIIMDMSLNDTIPFPFDVYLMLHMCGWVAKLDENGTIEWEKVFAPLFYWLTLDDIQQTRDGGYIATGYIYAVLGYLNPFLFFNDDVVIIKMDSKGRTNMMQLKTCGIVHHIRRLLGIQTW